MANSASATIIANAVGEPPVSLGVGVEVCEGLIPKPTAGPAVGEGWASETTTASVGCGAGGAGVGVGCGTVVGAGAAVGAGVGGTAVGRADTDDTTIESVDCEN